jgi:hypothetical protein
MTAAEHEHSSDNKCEDIVKPRHGIAKTDFRLDKNSRKRNGEKRQEEAEAEESHAIWQISETLDAVIMFAEGLNMIQHDKRRHYQSARVNLTKWLLGRIKDKGVLSKETGIEEAPLKYTKFDRVRVVEIIDGLLCCTCKY